MKTIKTIWNRSGKAARTVALAGTAALVFGSAVTAGVAMAAREAPSAPGDHAPFQRMGAWHGMFGGPGMMPGMMSERMEDRLFERLDTDKNGEISRAEIDAAREARKQRLAEMDTDKDGHVSREERRAYFAKEIEARRTEAFAKADANGDGGLNLDEYKARAADRAAQQFARLDRNGDGKLVPDELKFQRPMHDRPAR